MSGPLISIVIVCLDAGGTIAEAIGSVLSQSFEDFELVVVDGGSVDGTLGIVGEHESRSGGRMRWVSETDEGLFDAMNKALAIATGEYVEFLGADDRLRPAALQAVARTLDASSPDIVCGACHVFGQRAEWDEPASRKIRRGLPQRAPARHQSIFVRRETLLGVGGFDRRFRIAADYELYLRLVDAGSTEVLIADTLSDFRLGGVSSTDAWATARDYRDVRVSHGANPLVEQLMMVRSAMAATAFALWKRPT